MIRPLFIVLGLVVAGCATHPETGDKYLDRERCVAMAHLAYEETLLACETTDDPIECERNARWGRLGALVACETIGRDNPPPRLPQSQETTA